MCKNCEEEIKEFKAFFTLHPLKVGEKCSITLRFCTPCWTKIYDNDLLDEAIADLRRALARPAAPAGRWTREAPTEVREVLRIHDALKLAHPMEVDQWLARLHRAIDAMRARVQPPPPSEEPTT